MNSRRRKNNNGVKIFCGATVILFSAVLILSKISGGTEPQTVEQDKGSVSTASSQEIDVSETADISEYTGSDTQTETVTETTAEVIEPKPDPADADNTWAMFLVNSKNPVSEEYCDGIETALVYESWREYYMDSRMSEYLKKMLEAAAEDGHQLIVMSAYRSVKYQQDNFDKSVKDRMDNRGMTYEEAYEDTLKEVQLPGYSEHNAGVAADIMSDEYVSMDDDGFENTEAFKWLSENAADYGFVLRYPKGKEDVTGIIYEPWHYRFVGVYYAKLLTDRGITMEEYFEEMNWVDEDGISVYHLPELE